MEKILKYKVILPLWPKLTCDFICDPANEEAYKFATRQDWDRLIIYGSYGKTALAKYLAKNFNFFILDPNIQLTINNNNVIWDYIPQNFYSVSAFHAWNVYPSKIIVILENHPLSINILPNDLKTRLIEAKCVKIYPPSKNLKIQIFKLWLNSMHINITDSGLNFLFSTENDTLPNLYIKAKILHKYACENQREITIHSIHDCINKKIW